MSDSNSTAAALTIRSAVGDRVLPAIGAALLGLTLVFLTGFAPSDTLHNAAHDTRHSAAFPCH